MELCGKWNAWHDRIPGKTPTLRVVGKCCFTTDGWSVKLAKSVPQGTNPTDLLLDLDVKELSTTHLTVLTELDVEYTEETSEKFETVTIQVTGDDTGEGKTISVEEVS